MLIRKDASFIVILLSNDYLYKEYFLDNTGCLIIQANKARRQVESLTIYYNFRNTINKILIIKILVFKIFLTLQKNSKR